MMFELVRMVTLRDSDAFSLRNVQLLESKVEFLRNLVQFFCSLDE